MKLMLLCCNKSLCKFFIFNSEPSYPITSTIFTPNNTSFSLVLEAYIRNLRFNTSTTWKPFLIVTPFHVSHVQATIVCAKNKKFLMKNRNGGHDYEGLSYIDMKTETAWVETGATLGEVYYIIDEKMDNVVDALMVDVEGKLFDRKSMGEDLFWAITGGGEASFVPKTVIVFRVLKTLEQNSTDIVYNWHHFAPTINNNLFITLVLNVTQNGIKTIRETFVALFLGDSKSLVSLLNDKFSQLGLKQSDCIETSWLGSVLFSKNTNITALVEVFLNRQPQSVNYLKRKYHYVKKSISKEGLEGIWRKMIELVDTSLNFNPYGGRMAKIPSTTSHFPHRAGNLWKIQYLANWNKPGKEVANHYINLTRKLHNNNCNGKNSYAKGKVYGVKYFKDNFNRLVQIRTKVDPDNFFIVEQSIPMLSYHKLLE
uniref:Berberine/berberine-like domain-containing protein n=1 Tax=Glycine max TaxID=3847 RepID=K7K8Y0_SOYBN